MQLFKSNNPKIKDGNQCRDFIYINDVVDVIFFLYNNKIKSGIYNVGTGKPTTFKNLINYVFESLNKPKLIEYIDMPLDLKSKYQNYTKAHVRKLRTFGYVKEFSNIQDAVKDYISKFLI